MTEQYDNTNHGALFRNDTTGRSENFPQYGGSINIEGRDYWLSGWLKEGKRGKFFSLAVTPKEQRKRQAKPNSDDAPFEDDDIPF